MGESYDPAWVKAGSGPLPENFDVVVHCLPESSLAYKATRRLPRMREMKRRAASYAAFTRRLPERGE